MGMIIETGIMLFLIMAGLALLVWATNKGK